MNMIVRRDPAAMRKFAGELDQFSVELDRFAGRIVSSCDQALDQNRASGISDLLTQLRTSAEELRSLCPLLNEQSGYLVGSANFIREAECLDRAAMEEGKVLADCTSIRELQNLIEKIFLHLRGEAKETVKLERGSYIPEKSRHEESIDQVLDTYDDLIEQTEKRLHMLSDSESSEKDELLRLQNMLAERRADFHRSSIRYWNRQQEDISQLAGLVRQSQTYIRNYTAMLVQGIRAQDGWLSRPSAVPVFGQNYDSMEDIRNYLIVYKCLPPNYVDKATAATLNFHKGKIEINGVELPVSIGKDMHMNRDGRLPSFETTYYECDIDTLGKKKRGSKRIIYSEDLSSIYYTDTHYSFFDCVYWAPKI